MPATDDTTTPARRRVRLLAGLEEPATPGVTAEDTDSPVAKVFLYDEVGGWGVWPDDFQRTLAAITSPVIELHLHSPGGDAFDGIAMYNLLKQHQATVHGWVDGLAASAASVILMACDEITVADGGQVMVHDAWGMTVGPAEDMTSAAGQLDKISEEIAKIYAKRAGGTVASWRKAMRKETWYTGKEAVAAGLATRVEPKKRAAANRWDLQIFAHAGRAEAGPPELPELRPSRPTTADSPAVAAQRMKAAADRARLVAPPATATGAGSMTKPEEAPTMPVDVAKLREALGLTPETSADDALAAFAGALTQIAPAAPATAVVAATEDTGPLAPPQINQTSRTAGAVLLDPDLLHSLQQKALKGEQAWAQMKRNERDHVIRDAITKGKFAASREEYWRQLWDRDPDGTRQSIDDLAANVIPVLSAGYLGDDSAHRSADEQAYTGLFGPEEGR